MKATSPLGPFQTLQDLKKASKPSEDYSINLLDPINFQLNKFFYKNIGKNHRWVDRLAWIDNQWIDYVSDKKVKTYVLKHKNDLAGFFELMFHLKKKEAEIAYFGLLEEYHIMRHLVNLETVKTYEGAEDIHALILGKFQTNLDSF